jgi:hypothetical protein
VCQSNLDSAKYNPQDIHQNRKATHRVLAWNNLTAKWAQRKPSQAHNLHAKWDTHDGKAQKQTSHKIEQRGQEASKNNPKNISDKIHRI